MRVAIGLVIALFGGLQNFAPAEADDILAQLSKIRLDKKQIYVIRDVTLRRDVLSVTINRGVIAFLEPVNGKVTGAVFVGSGEIVAIGPNAIERQQISRFTGTPVLNETFQTAILRFTDNTYEDLRNEISQHAQEDVSAEEAAQFDSWDTAMARRAAALDLRILADLVEPRARPFFFAELESDKRGWFNVSFDLRAVEEVSIYQVRQIGNTAAVDIWGSFNQRSEARDLAATAHESKAAAEVLAYDFQIADPAGANETVVTMHLKARTDGARVLNFELSPVLRVTSVAGEDGEVVRYFAYFDSTGFAVVLPRPLKAEEEFTLRVAYSGNLTGAVAWYPIQRQSRNPSFKSNVPLPEDKSIPFVEYSNKKLIAAGYHDQWLVDGLSRYLPALAAEASGSATELEKLLTDARDQLKSGDAVGPIWLGPRLASTLTPDGYRTVTAKGVWVLHMLRWLMKQNGSDPDGRYNAALNEFFQTFDGTAASTWDFKRVFEKHAGQRLDWFFDEWVFATGIPNYTVDYKIESSGSEYTVEGTIVQTGVPDGFAMPVPVYADNQYLGTVQVGETDNRFRFRVANRPERILIDPQQTILIAAP